MTETRIIHTSKEKIFQERIKELTSQGWSVSSTASSYHTDGKPPLKYYTMLTAILLREEEKQLPVMMPSGEIQPRPNEPKFPPDREMIDGAENTKVGLIWKICLWLGFPEGHSETPRY